MRGVGGGVSNATAGATHGGPFFPSEKERSDLSLSRLGGLPRPSDRLARFTERGHRWSLYSAEARRPRPRESRLAVCRFSNRRHYGERENVGKRDLSRERRGEESGPETPLLLPLLHLNCTDTWLILPVVICLSERLSHACPSTSPAKVKPRMAH